jgi:hypothetical protein
VTRVVQDLKLRPAVVRALQIFSHAEHDPTVAAGRHFPFELKLEVGVLLATHQINGHTLGPRDGTLFNSPAVWHTRHLIAAPMDDCLAVKKGGPLRLRGLTRQRGDHRDDQHRKRPTE